MAKCSVGLLMDSHVSCDSSDFESIESLSNEEQQLLFLRSKVSAGNICYQHKKKYLSSSYDNHQNHCCDPFQIHKRLINKSIKTITLNFCKEAAVSGIDLVPGKKLCISCNKKIYEATCNPPMTSVESESDYVPQLGYKILDNLNKSFEASGCSPLKVKKRKACERLSYLQKKGKQICERVVTSAAEALHIDQPAEQTLSVQKEGCLNCEELMQQLRRKFCSSSIKSKVQILTLVPTTWSIRKTIDFFHTTEYMVKRARQIKTEQGILGVPGSKKGAKLSEEITSLVQDFYRDDSNSRICPGKKDCVSVPTESGKRELIQKRLILLNLKELYELFKEKFPHVSIGFSKFCEFRPKECVTASSHGLHSTCVCMYHQNVKLMLHAAHINVDYKQLMAMLVCSLESEVCMLHRCPACPPEDTLRTFLLNNDALSSLDTITYWTWEQVDRTTMSMKTLSVDEFINSLVEKLVELRCHHFISKSQSNFFKKSKEELTEDMCIILVDFAENYTCIVQDSAQGFHWENIQATVHPVVVYFRYASKSTLDTMKICFISDCLTHTTAAFYAFQTLALRMIREKLPHITHAMYFSDGSSAQYKNFMNLCRYKEDHGITAEWHFFATSHGKNACDGLGGTLKRLATRASLQRPYEYMILSPEDLYNFCVKNIPGIDVYYVREEEIKESAMKQELRYSIGKTITGTRSSHCFKPVDEFTLKVSRISTSSDTFTAKVTKDNAITTESLSTYSKEEYVACVYNEKWWLGKITDVSQDHEDCYVHFLHPHGPTPTYIWPQQPDLCWVPFGNILQKVSPPVTTTGRTYSISQKVTDKITDLFATWK